MLPYFVQEQGISFRSAGEILFVASNSIYVATLLLPAWSHENSHLLLKSSFKTSILEYQLVSGK